MVKSWLFNQSSTLEKKHAWNFFIIGQSLRSSKTRHTHCTCFQETEALPALKKLLHTLDYGQLKYCTWDFPITLSQRYNNRCYLWLNLARKCSVGELVQLAGGVQEVPTRMTNCDKLPVAKTLFKSRRLQALCFHLNAVMNSMQLAYAGGVTRKTQLRQPPDFLLPSALTVYVPRLFRFCLFFVSPCESAQIN